MDAFISWSGERSRKIAEALGDWLPVVISGIHAWVSSKDLPKGAKWTSEIATHGDRPTIAIICLTPTNVQSPWISFEAGALDRSVGSRSVFVYLVGLEPSQIRGPLSRFQACRANAADTLRLVQALNKTMGEGALQDSILTGRFRQAWPLLEKRLGELSNELSASERRVDRDATRAAPSNATCYVAISDDKDSGLFSMAIVPALRGSGLVPIRRDSLAPVSLSSRAQIETAALIIGDVSSRENRVLYELGVAHALGKPIILLAQEGSDVPFDLAHFRVLEYRPSDFNSLRKLRRTLTDVIRLTVTDVERLKSERSDVTWDYEPDDLVERAAKAQKEGRLKDAAELLEQAAGALDERADYSSAAAVYNNLASVYQSLGLYSRALVYIQRSIDLQQRTNNRQAEAVSTGNLASIFDALGDLDQAQSSYKRAIQLARSVGNKLLLGSLFNNLGQLYARQRRIVDAEEMYREALAIFQGSGNPRWTGSTLSNLAALKQSLGQVDEARQLFDTALAMFEALDDKESVARVLHNLAAVQVEAGNPAEGERLLRKSLELKNQMGDTAGQASALLSLAQIEMNSGSLDRAVNHLLEATSIQQRVGDRYGLMVALSLLSTILEASGTRDKAIDFLERAVTIAADLNVPERVVLDKRLAQLKLSVPATSSDK